MFQLPYEMFRRVAALARLRQKSPRPAFDQCSVCCLYSGRCRVRTQVAFAEAEAKISASRCHQRAISARTSSRGAISIATSRGPSVAVEMKFRKKQGFISAKSFATSQSGPPSKDGDRNAHKAKPEAVQQWQAPLGPAGVTQNAGQIAADFFLCASGPSQPHPQVDKPTAA